MQVRYGLLETQYTGEASTQCADSKCETRISPGHRAFLDVSGEETRAFCKFCGPCIRYARKKAAAAGRPEPRDLED